MCEMFAIESDDDLIVQAREAVDEILKRYLHLPVHKVMDLSTPTGFDRAVASLARGLRAKAAEPDREAMRAVIEVLDVDWPNTTRAQRASLVEQALQAAGRKVAEIPQSLEMIFGNTANDVVGATRTTARTKQNLRIAADLNALDKRVIRYLTTSQSGFIRDEYGRRNQAFGNQARSIVAEGLEAGLGRDDISQTLAKAAEQIVPGRNAFYWEVVSGSFISQGRSFSQLSAYAEAGIERYIIEAILDERTTEICRYLHGKTFTVASALQTFERLEAEPDAIKDIVPWVRESTDAETGRKTMFVERGSERLPVAEVSRSAMGTRDDRGEFSRNLSERDLLDLGISFPPYHGLCRSTTIPVV